jgi:putative membrane protein
MFLGVNQMMWPMWGMGGMMWFWVLLIFGVGYWVWWYGPREISRPRHLIRVNPLELAKTRLAKGEITLDEFEEIKKAIQTS